MLGLEGASETNWPVNVNCFPRLVIHIAIYSLNFIIKEIEFLSGERSELDLPSIYR